MTKEGDDGASDKFWRLENFVFCDLDTSWDIFEDGIIFLFVHVHSNVRAFISTLVVTGDDSLYVWENIRLLVLVLEEGSDDDSEV